MLDDLKTARALGGFLAPIGDTELARFADMLVEGQIQQGATLKATGEPCDEAFVVLEGRLRLGDPTSPPGRGVHQEYEAGDLVGAVPLTTGEAIEGHLHCLEGCRFARLTSQNFDRLLKLCPALWSGIHEIALSEMHRVFLTKHLNELFGPFGNLLPHVVQEFEAEARWRTLGSGETLYQEGDPADLLYLVMTGRLFVATEDRNGRERVQRTISEGGIVGEVGLLMDRPHTHTVFAGRDSELVCLPRSSFLLLLERSSNAVLHVSRLLAERLEGAPTQRASGEMAPRSITVLPARSSTSVDEIVCELRTALEEAGKVTVLSSESVDRALGVPGISRAKESEPAHLRLVQWLHQQEAEDGYLIYQADATWSEWSERCVRHTDRVVVAAESLASPGLCELEQHMEAPRRRWGLVLLHPAGTDRPRNTAAWLEDSRVEDVYHVRQRNRADFARLARILSGRAVGLVLGGGGARGFAHLGVLRALEELNVPVDMVGGTSIGASLAVHVAQGLDATKSSAAASQAYRNLIDYSLPLVSFLSGGRLTKTIENGTATWDIEDFWLPYFSLSTNLTRARSQVHTRGDSVRAVRATVSIPGVFPPVSDGEDVLVDGGVLNNVPMDIMRERNPFGTVIAVDVAAPAGPTAEKGWPLHVSGWRLALDRLLPWRRASQIPGVASTILQSMMVGSVSARQSMLNEGLADIYLNIVVRGVGLLEFEEVEKIAQLGYDESIDTLRQWVAKERP